MRGVRCRGGRHQAVDVLAVPIGQVLRARLPEDALDVRAQARMYPLHDIVIGTQLLWGLEFRV